MNWYRIMQVADIYPKLIGKNADEIRDFEKTSGVMLRQQSEHTSKKLSVLYIISNPIGWTGETSLGGGEVKAVETLKRLFRCGVHVETLETSPSPSLLLHAPYHIHVVSTPLRMTHAFDTFVIIPILTLKFIRESFRLKHPVEIVIASNSNLGDVLPAWIIAKILRKPLVVSFLVLNYRRTLTSMYTMFKGLNFNVPGAILATLSSFFALVLSRSASAVVCLSDNVRTMLKEIGFLDSSLFVTSGGVSLENIEAAATTPKEFDAVYLGRIEISKGIFDILHAWRIVTKRRSDARLVLLGIGQAFDIAKAKAEEMGIDRNIEFKGFVGDDRKYTYLKCSRIFIFASKSEGWALSIAEAMACGLPVICYDIPTFKTLYNDCESVIRVPIADVQELASQILYLLDHQDKLKEYSTISKAYIQKYDWDNVAKRELEMLRKILRSSRESL